MAERFDAPGRVWPLVGAATMQALDRHTIDDLGVPGEVLMESAGRAVTEVALLEFRALPGATGVRIVCGTGNNGGDGFVVARHLAQAGVACQIELVGESDRLSEDASRNLARAKAVGVEVDGREMPGPAVWVDALFGTGLSRDVEGAAREAIGRMERAREEGSRVVAVDVPSGLDADCGQVLGAAVRADRTVAIGLPKLGLALEPGRSLAGKISVARIGIADRAPGIEPEAQLWSATQVGTVLPERPAVGHKGTFGHVLVVGGSEGKTGAAVLAAAGAGRSGAGLVTLACPESLNPILEAKCTEAMTVPVPETAEKGFSSRAVETLLELARERSVAVLGPGVGACDEVRAAMRTLAERMDVPLVLDAEGLTALEGHLEILSERTAPTWITPHPGEAARLLGISSAQVNADRIAAATSLAERSGAVVVLKGAATVCVEPAGRKLVNPTGGPALATGGTGDVLAGMVGGLCAQGLPGFEAAACAVYVHGAASDRLAARQGNAGILAGDLAEAVPETLGKLRLLAADAESSEDGGEALALPFPGA